MANIIIYGMGSTGQAMYRRLCIDNNVWLYDDNARKCTVSLLDIPYDCIDVCIISPGISANAPLVEQLQLRNIPIIGEWQYCAQLCTDTLVSVTGTNGKTTITEMIYHILEHSGISSALLGNGGIPWCSDIGTDTADNRITILESSSFQLQRSGDFSPYISVLSNIASDHIDYHGSMREYISCKANNFANQHSGQYAVFYMDDDIAMDMSRSCLADTLYYSADNIDANCHICNDNVVLCVDSVVQCNMGILSTYCSHDKCNALCAILVCYLLGVSISNSIDCLASYQVSAHKMQCVAICQGITYIDDSKATNISATLSAVHAVSGDIALILGGSDKGYTFDSLIVNLPSNVVYVAIVGDTAQCIAYSCRKHNRQHDICCDMHSAVECCTNKLNGNGTVLLSPSCASFDRYASYRHRGEDFVQAVNMVISC